MNWKKEGYKVDQFVFIVINNIFINNTRTTEGKVTYVGTKNLNITTSGGVNIKMKNGENRWHDGLGDYYEVYKSKEEYEKLLIEKKDIYDLKNKIINLLNGVQNKELLKEIALKLEENK